MSFFKQVFFIILYAGVGVAAATALPRVGIDPTVANVSGGGVALLALLCHMLVTQAATRETLEGRIFELEFDRDDLRQTVNTYEDDIAQLHLRIDTEAGLKSIELASEVKVLHGLLTKLEDQAGVDHAPLPGRKPPVRPIQVESSEHFEDAEILEIVRTALETNRIDLYLQPIVGLPARKVQYYEAYSRLRNEAGVVVYPGQYLHLAEREGMISILDNLLMFRCVQVVRQTRSHHRDRQFFVNISSATLSDESFIVQFMDFIGENPDLADRIILEIAQSDIKGMDRIIESRLEALAAMNFRFSMDHVTDLDIDFHGLSLLNFRYVKIGAAIFLGQDGPLHRADFNEAVTRNGLKLILEKIEDDSALVELLDHDIRLGQGYLFGAPRRSDLGEGKAIPQDMYYKSVGNG